MFSETLGIFSSEVFLIVTLSKSGSSICFTDSDLRTHFGFGEKKSSATERLMNSALFFFSERFFQQ